MRHDAPTPVIKAAHLLAPGKMSVKGQFLGLSSALCVFPPEFAQNLLKFPAQGYFCPSSIFVVFWPGCARSVVSTNAKLGPAWRLVVLWLVVRQTSAAAQGAQVQMGS